MVNLSNNGTSTGTKFTVLLVILSFVISGFSLAYQFEPRVFQDSEAAANCSLNKFAQNETAIGAFTCGLPVTLTKNQGLHTCTLTTVSTVATGFNIAYTTQANTQGTVMIVLGFQVTYPSVVAPPVTTQITVIENTGTAPTCGAAVPGGSGLCSATYTFTDSWTSLTGAMPMTLTCVLSGASASTAYWFDLRITDSTTDSWVFLLRNAAIVDT